MDHVLNWLWQGSAIAVATFALLRALERSRASARYVLCWVALLAVLLLPIIAVLQPGLSGPAPFPVAAAPGPAMVSIPGAWWTSWPVVGSLCALWLALFVVRLSGALLKVRSARADCRPLPPSLESQLHYWTTVRLRGRRARLAVSEGAGAAAVLGCGAPVIVVAPALVQHLGSEELDRVVVHEWVHVQRRDDLLNLVQLAARALAGWHPAVWWLDRQLLLEREMACDEAVVALTGSPKAYASSLTSVASLFPRRWAFASVGALSSPALSRRVVRILSRASRLSPRWSIGAVTIAMLLLGALSFTVGGLRLIGIAAPPARFERAAAIAPAPVQPVDVVQTPLQHREERAAERANTRAPSGAAETARSQPAAAAQTQPLWTDPAATATAEAPSAATVAGDGDPAVLRSTPLVSALSVPATASASLTQTATSPYAAAIPQSSPDVRPISPWGAAAGAGVAIGRGSQKVGVATATFFGRVGKKIGQSF